MHQVDHKYPHSFFFFFSLRFIMQMQLQITGKNTAGQYFDRVSKQCYKQVKERGMVFDSVTFP